MRTAYMVGTNSGISRYSRHQNLFYNYYISGSNRSVLQTANTLFFGNNYALTYFNPETVEMIPSIKKNLLLDLEVNNKHVAIGEKRNGQVILQKGLPYTDELTLAYANRDFSLSFSNLLYSEEHQKYNLSFCSLIRMNGWYATEEKKLLIPICLPVIMCLR